MRGGKGNWVEQGGGMRKLRKIKFPEISIQKFFKIFFL